jgi:hypothetical protein
MKPLTILVALFFIVVGVVGLIAPLSLFHWLQYSITPIGLYVVAVLRIGIGIVLLGAASMSQTPKTFRVFGIIALIAGLTTPLLGVERAHGIMEWWFAQASIALRMLSLVALILGGFIMYSIVSWRRAA